MKSLKLIALAASALTISCSGQRDSNNKVYETSRWSRSETAPPRRLSLESQVYDLKIGSKKLNFEQQYIQGVEVEDSFYKSVISKEPEFVSYNWITHVPLALRARILLMKLQAPLISYLFKWRHPNYSTLHMYEKPRLVVRNGEVYWKITFENKLYELKGFYTKANLDIASIEKVGSDYVNANAILFPDGPLRSKLQDVVLPNLVGNGTLTSPILQVTTESDQKALAQNSVFQYPVDDPRFEQVQVFYYVSKVVHWCESELNFVIPFSIQVETNVGYPEKTNTAFYYQRKIRLGEGDGVAFARIPMDPSIVVHEAFHGLNEAVSRLPYQNEGGSLNEAYSDFFTAMLLENPRLGEVAYKKGPYKRTVANDMKLSEKNGGLYHDSEIISGLLWNLQQRLGRETGLMVAWNTLQRLTPLSNFQSFQQELQDVLKQLPMAQQDEAQAVLKSRGWL